MSNPRKPDNVHLLKGTYRADRHAKNATPLAPMDPEPPESLEPEHRDSWAAVVMDCRPYLAQSDRIAVELAARLLTASRTGQCNAAQEAMLHRLLSKLGGTPEGRARLLPIAATNPTPNAFEAL